jgi:predicted transcriptional regulator
MTTRDDRTSIKKAREKMGFFRLQAAEYRRLQALARAEAIPVSAIVRRAITEFLSRTAA